MFRLQADCKVQSISVHTTRPIMFFRPSAPDGSPFLRLALRPGANARKAATALQALLARDGGAHGNLGMRFLDTAFYESEVGGGLP